MNSLRKKSLIITLLATLLLGGCVTHEGITFRSPEIGAFSPKYMVAGEDKFPGGIIVIADTSVLRVYEQADYEELHQEYREYFSAEPKREFTYTVDNLKSRFIGFVGIRTFSIPGVMGTYYYALVPRTLNEVGYSNKVSTFLLGTAEDLVAARTDSDGLLVVEKLLCDRNKDYRTCARRFKRGVFDGESGVQLGSDYKPKKKGKTIDVNSYEVL